MDTFQTNIHLKIANYKEKLIGSNLPFDELNLLINSNKLIILHFLRHLGCIHCKNSVSQLNELRKSTFTLPQIYFIHPATLEKGNRFFRIYYPNASHISDTKLSLYKLFQINSQNVKDLLNMSFIVNIIQAIQAGHRHQNDFHANNTMLSGTFLFNQGQLIWAHRAKVAGEEPHWKKLAQNY